MKYSGVGLGLTEVVVIIGGVVLALTLIIIFVEPKREQTEVMTTKVPKVSKEPVCVDGFMLRGDYIMVTPTGSLVKC